MRDLPIKPYLIRAVYEWCVSNDATPHLTALSSCCNNLPTDLSVHKYVTLNINLAAISGLQMNNEFVEFNTRFNGSVKKITIPVEAIRSIFSKESGQGLNFFPEITNNSGTNLVEAEDNKEQAAIRIKNPKNDIETNPDKPSLKIVK